MSTALSSRRRTVLVTSLAILATLASSATPSAAQANRTSAQAASSIEPSDRWLDGLKAKHRQFFDAPSPGGGIGLVHVMNYYDTYNKAYKVKDSDIDAVLTFYGATTFYALNDAAWAKYRLGEFLETNDPATGKPATKNPWRTAPNVLGMSLPGASIDALAGRGTTFILCNNALQIFAGMLASKRGLDANAVYADLKANIIPSVHLVPAMVIAVEQATRAGLSYQRQ